MYTRIRTFIALSILMIMCLSCDDFADMIAKSPCIGNDDAELCVKGERAGSLEETSNLHCCENAIFRSKNIRPCALSADATSEIAGEFTSALKVNKNTKVNIDIRSIKYGAFHKKREGHCNRHDDVCEDELIGQEYKIVGKISISADLSAQLDLLTVVLKELGLDASQVTNTISQVQGKTKTILTSKGVMASICEERDHNSCPSVDGDPVNMVAVTSNSELQLDSLIEQTLNPKKESETD